jgi:hypothetical protein
MDAPQNHARRTTFPRVNRWIALAGSKLRVNPRFTIAMQNSGMALHPSGSAIPRTRWSFAANTDPAAIKALLHYRTPRKCLRMPRPLRVQTAVILSVAMAMASRNKTLCKGRPRFPRQHCIQ